MSDSELGCPRSSVNPPASVACCRRPSLHFVGSAAIQGACRTARRSSSGVEQRIRNAWVGGSIPSCGTRIKLCPARTHRVTTSDRRGCRWAASFSAPGRYIPGDEPMPSSTSLMHVRYLGRIIEIDHDAIPAATCKKHDPRKTRRRGSSKQGRSCPARVTRRSNRPWMRRVFPIRR